MPETVLLIDENDAEIGLGEKMDVHRQGQLHRAFSIFVFNNRSELLLQKRAGGKYHSAGLWTNTCCGHPRPGESSKLAAQRRLMEEFGFTCSLNQFSTFRYQTEFTNGLKENELSHLFFGRFDLQPHPDPTEIENYSWMSLSNVTQDIRQYPERYTYWFNVIMNDAKKLQALNKELSREASA